MARSPKEAIAWARREVRNPSKDWSGRCQEFTRRSLGLDGGLEYGSAIKVWLACPPQFKHPLEESPPGGMPVYWSIGMYGHAALAADRDGWCFSTDIKRRGKIDRVPIDLITKRWGAKYLGSTRWCNGVPLHVVEQSISVGRNLTAGMSGEDVKALQRKLAVTVTGTMDPETIRALNKLKDRMGLYADGVAGPKLRGALGLP